MAIQLISSKRLWVSGLAALAVLLSATAAFATPAGTLLKGLKLPGGLTTLFAANAVGQTSLNGQLGGTPESLLVKAKALLSVQGYKERTINTVVGPWGFNLVLDPPAGTTVDGTPSGKTAALVLQSTALGPGKLNLNVRFEAL
ncbi:hypothetical protein [Cyanobium sp. ATX 6F1]|uniref:hypothetical protein n=1 Tax=unclassified Cyanobium TaxID=2627006 RepID=UPI0020CC3468|nr:hypothetical protein [Cyanobium sp. ATX 6F1]MCP9916360.1 hypothetical protein [Cyanobium sp. ATX 6F1]